jgi:hypothetical protein
MKARSARPILLHIFVVVLLVYGSLEVFSNLLGTRIPFALILASTYLTRLYVAKSPGRIAAARQAGEGSRLRNRLARPACGGCPSYRTAQL